MKKNLFTILMLLLTVTAAWAGDGNGSKDNPYTGSWDATKLKQDLKVGDHLAYDCVIDGGSITVYDDSLMVSVVRGWATWAVGDPIDDSPFAIYNVGSDYCTLYSLEERKGHTFQITGFIKDESTDDKKDEEKEDDDQNRIAITGHYSGKYISGDGSHGMSNKSSVYVEDSISRIRVHNVKELTDAIKEHGKDSNAIIQLMNDIDMSDYDTPHEEDDEKFDITFNAQLCGYYNKRYEDGEFVTDKKGDKINYTFELKHQKRPLFGSCEKAKIQGIQFTEADLSSMVMFRSNLVCAGAYDTEFTDVTIFGCRYTDEFFVKKIPYIDIVYNVMFGGNAGQVATRMENCTVKRVNVIGSTFFMRGSGVGNIAGTAKKTTFEDCFADAGSTIFVEASDDAYVGGLVGQATDCSFTECVNMSTVCGSRSADNVGGICGESTRCSFEHCYNGGVLAQTTMETWITTTVRSSYDILSSIKTIAEADPLGNAIKNIQIEYANYCNITSKQLLAEELSMSAISEVEVDYAAMLGEYISAAMALYAVYTVTFNIVVALNEPDEIGGISSASHGCSFNRCMNAGRIFCRDAWAGGIVGRAYSDNDTKTKFDKCVNIGYVQGDELTGGIVGAMEDDCEILNCLNTSTIDCRENTFGPIYGKKTDGTTVKNCFAMTRDAEDHTDGLTGGDGVTKVSYRDVLGGRVAYELNRSTNSQVFYQNVGRQLYPTLFGRKIVEVSDIINDIDTVLKAADFNGFINAIFNQYADIELLNDIDCKGNFVSVYRKCTPFRGTINGKGYSLKNIRSEGADLGSDASRDNALIGAAEGATFKDLSLNACNMELPYRAAGLVCESTRCKYENVHLVGGTVITAKGGGVGGIIYESKADTLINCSVGDDCTVKGIGRLKHETSDVGGIAFHAVGSEFTDCYNKGKVEGVYGHVGGIVAECEDSEFKHCVNDKSAVVSIEKEIVPVIILDPNGKPITTPGEDKKSGDYGAGIAAKAEHSWFRKCVNYGKVDARFKYAGGIVGHGDGIWVLNCLNSTPSGFLVFGDKITTAGSIIGEAVNHSEVSNCAANKDGKYPSIGKWSDMQRTAGHNYMLGGLGDKAGQWEMAVTQAEFDNGKVCYWLNEGKEDGPWRQNGSELTLDEGSPVTLSDIVNEDKDYVFKISTAEDLKAFADHVNSGNEFACAILMNDINMADKEFTPIGKNEDHKHFRGIIDGRGHTIDSLKVKSDHPVGLIGAAHSHAEVHNLIIGKGSEFLNTGSVEGLGDEGAGGIIGRVSVLWRWGNVRIKNCGSYANIKVNKHGGGIFGRINTNETENNVVVYINNCFSMGTVTAHNGNSGLLSGYMKNQGNVSDCWSGGQLRTSQPKVKPFSTENNFGEWELLIGFDEGKMEITNCYVVKPDQNVDEWDKNHYQGGVNVVENIEDLANGKFAYLINGNSNDTKELHGWQQNLGTDAHPVFGNKGIYHARDIKEEYGTVCLPYTLYSNDDVRYYGFSNVVEDENEIRLQFQYASKIMPGTPTIFHSKTTGDHTFIDEPDKYEGTYNKYDFDLSIEKGGKGWMMHSHPFEKVFEGEDAKTVYYLSNNELKNDEKTTIAPYHVYFRGPSADELTSWGIKTVRLVIEDEEGSTTVIQSPELMRNEQCVMRNYYNLAGQKVGDSYRGIVIKNGKKVLVK